MCWLIPDIAIFFAIDSSEIELEASRSFSSIVQKKEGTDEVRRTE